VPFVCSGSQRSIAHVQKMKKPSLPNLARASGYAAALAALGVVLASGVVRCPFAAILHQPCPGCGTTRAVRALLSLDFGAAFRFNPVAPFVVLSIAVIAVEGLWLVVREGHAKNLGLRTATTWAMRALAVAVVLEVPIWALRFFGLFGGPVPV
jgi:hypothetical protein